MPALPLFIASAGLDAVSGVFGYIQSKQMASAYRSRADLIRMEAEANAQRYAEQASHFQQSQAVSYLKSGVKLTGSPLDVLDETARVAAENLSAIRAGGRASAFDQELHATETEMAGRNSLLKGFSQAALSLGQGAYSSGRTGFAGMPRNDYGMDMTA